MQKFNYFTFHHKVGRHSLDINLLIDVGDEFHYLNVPNLG